MSVLDRCFQPLGRRLRGEHQRAGQDGAPRRVRAVEGREHGAAAWLHSHYDQHYTDQWHFRSIDDIEWGDSPVY